MQSPVTLRDINQSECKIYILSVTGSMTVNRKKAFGIEKLH